MQNTKMKRDEVRARVERRLYVAAALAATIGLAPAARADPDRAGSASPREVRAEEQSAATSASTPELREGDEVRASYQDANGETRAIRIEPKRESAGKEGIEEGHAVQTMSPDDPEWDQVHQGG
jgi:hypothetical protein